MCRYRKRWMGVSWGVESPDGRALRPSFASPPLNTMYTKSPIPIPLHWHNVSFQKLKIMSERNEPYNFQKRDLPQVMRRNLLKYPNLDLTNGSVFQNLMDILYKITWDTTTKWTNENLPKVQLF